MKTELLKIESPQETEKLRRAAEVLRRGGLCGIPTETVYGLAANALDEAAVHKIFAAKGRPQDNPLIVHIASMEELPALVRVIPPEAEALAAAFWPGPLTIILPKADCIPDAVSCALPTVAIRMPSHPIANAIIRTAGIPLAAPSANTSGRPSPTTAVHVLHDLDGRIDMVVDGGACSVGVESTVVTLCDSRPRLLRPGGVTLEQLRDVLGNVDVDKAVLGELPRGEKPSSPGMKYKHYSPQADVKLIRGSLDSFAEYAKAFPVSQTLILCFDGEESAFEGETITLGAATDAEAHARTVFRALREADARGFRTVLAHCPDDRGVDLAVLNRLLRAAAFQVVETEGESV